MGDRQRTIQRLVEHRSRLEAATNFDEWKAAHLTFVNSLIVGYEREERLLYEDALSVVEAYASSQTSTVVKAEVKIDPPEVK